MQGGEDLSIEELASNLSTYKGQLRQVRKLLSDDPGNSEYADMEKELEEVLCRDGTFMLSSDFRCSRSDSKFEIQIYVGDILTVAKCGLNCSLTLVKLLKMQVINLTEELLAAAKQAELSGLPSKSDADASPSQLLSDMSQMNPGLNMHSESHEFSIGTKVQAVWSEDGEWYDATIEALTPNGYYVSYDGWGNKEEVDPGNMRPIEGVVDALREAERDAEATRQAIKRKIAQAADADFQSRTVPAKLRIDPSDPEDIKAAKRKKIHAFKSKVRFEQLEVVQNKRQNAWQQFQTSKGQSKKVGFFTGRKRESIFKSPDDPKGKVGVTGSGKGLTEFQRREKHLHLKGGNADTDE